VRSGPGDTDLVRYSLRKYMRLAVKGNPTVLLPLFAPQSAILHSTTDGQELRDLAHAIVSEQAGPRFLGYLVAQLERMEGTRSKRVNRPELVEKFGFDVKFAGHALRLGIQGVELMSEGRIHLPMRQEHRDRIQAIKTGQVPHDEVLAEIREWEERLRFVLAHPTGAVSKLPDLVVVSGWMVRAHRAWWGREGRG
jgi:predicted nucleotidyltransferase